MRLPPLLLGLLLLASPLLASPPNVIVLMTDDQGYGDLSCHGNPVLNTPHLDALHARSARLTDFHVSPMCTPTRGSLLTGLDPARHGASNVSSGRTRLRAGIPTLADVFAGAGYATGIFGKWHLGDSYPCRPEDRGFQETLWFPSSHINSVPDHWDNDYFDDRYRHNGELESYEGYCTDVFFREAIAWMREQHQAGQPFFTYLPTNAPHSPYWLPDRYRKEMTLQVEQAEAERRLDTDLASEKRADLIDFLAMIQNIDDNVGHLDKFLGESGLLDNTILVFLTDNGSTMGHLYFNAGMRGRKTQLWEGGHRVPCFVRHPAGGIDRGHDVGGLAQVQDLFPTLLDLAGIESEVETDGLNLAPALRGDVDLPEDRMLIINYSRMPFAFDYPSPDSPSRMRREGAAVLWKHWRLLQDRELYDLERDPKQQRNVLAAHRKVAERLSARLDSWWAEVEHVANEVEPVVIGHPEENPVLLTACEWLDVFVDQQSQIRRAVRKNSWWEIEVAEPGQYEFELRRWPRETDLPLTAGLEATEVADATLLEGQALPIARARMQIGTRPLQVRPVKAEDQAVTFKVKLPAGRTRLHTWFDDADRQALVGAYYVYARRLEPNR